MIQIYADILTFEGSIGTISATASDWDEAMATLEGWRSAVGDALRSVRLEFL